MSPLRYPAPGAFAALSLLIALSACDDSSLVTGADEAAVPPTGQRLQSNTIRYYGIPTRIGDGLARTYVLVDRRDHEIPLEVGVALTDRALSGLPAEGETTKLLDLPPQNTTPYRFVELDWNPAGHEPPGVYDVPHFDFHFYTVTKETRSSILPSDPQFAIKAANLPAEEFRPPFYLDQATAAGLPAAMVTVPQMGLHWFDVRSPELQAIAGNPAGFQPFTKTFLIGSWDGGFIFTEPMITRAYLLAKRSATDPAVRDETITVPTAQSYSPAGYYPGAYRIAYDAAAHEYLVGLTQLAPRE
jgi:hypothetical protein